MGDEKKKYRLDRTSFKAMTFEEADNHYGFWRHKSFAERMDAAFYLIHQVYGTNKSTPLDKTVFSCRKNK
jgi:hypothetical protein